MREILAPEVELGVVSPAELDVLAGPRSAARAYVRARPRPRAARRVLAAETRLARPSLGCLEERCRLADPTLVRR